MQPERISQFKTRIAEAITLHYDGEADLIKYLNQDVVRDYSHSDYKDQTATVQEVLLGAVEEYKVCAADFARDNSSQLSEMLKWRKKTIHLLELITVPLNSVKAGR